MAIFLFQKLIHPKYSVIYTIKYLIVLKFYGIKLAQTLKNDLPSFDDFIENVTKKRERFAFASDSLDDIVDLSLGDYYLGDTKNLIGLCGRFMQNKIFMHIAKIIIKS